MPFNNSINHQKKKASKGTSFYMYDHLLSKMNILQQLLSPQANNTIANHEKKNVLGCD